MKNILLVLLFLFSLTISADTPVERLEAQIKIVKTEIKAYQLKVKYDSTDSESAGLLAGKKAELKVLQDNLKLAKDYLKVQKEVEDLKKDLEKAQLKQSELYNKVKTFIYE